MHALQWGLGQILELSGYYWKTCTLHAGVKLDVFTAIGEEKLAAADTARKLGVDQRALAMLLDALTAMGLLSKSEDGRYSNTPESLDFLSKESPRYIGFMIMHHHHLVDSWSQLIRPCGPGVRSGGGPRLMREKGERASSWGCSTWP
mgnify:CR=1 FL=1